MESLAFGFMLLFSMVCWAASKEQKFLSEEALGDLSVVELHEEFKFTVDAWLNGDSINTPLEILEASLRLKEVSDANFLEYFNDKRKESLREKKEKEPSISKCMCRQAKRKVQAKKKPKMSKCMCRQAKRRRQAKPLPRQPDTDLKRSVIALLNLKDFRKFNDYVCILSDEALLDLIDNFNQLYMPVYLDTYTKWAEDLGELELSYERLVVRNRRCCFDKEKCNLERRLANLVKLSRVSNVAVPKNFFQ